MENFIQKRLKTIGYLLAWGFSIVFLIICFFITFPFRFLEPFNFGNSEELKYFLFALYFLFYSLLIMGSFYLTCTTGSNLVGPLDKKKLTTLNFRFWVAAVWGLLALFATIKNHHYQECFDILLLISWYPYQSVFDWVEIAAFFLCFLAVNRLPVDLKYSFAKIQAYCLVITSGLLLSFQIFSSPLPMATIGICNFTLTAICWIWPHFGSSIKPASTVKGELLPISTFSASMESSYTSLFYGVLIYTKLLFWISFYKLQFMEIFGEMGFAFFGLVLGFVWSTLSFSFVHAASLRPKFLTPQYPSEIILVIKKLLSPLIAMFSATWKIIKKQGYSTPASFFMSLSNPSLCLLDPGIQATHLPMFFLASPFEKNYKLFGSVGILAAMHQSQIAISKQFMDWQVGEQYTKCEVIAKEIAKTSTNIKCQKKVEGFMTSLENYRMASSDGKQMLQGPTSVEALGIARECVNPPIPRHGKEGLAGLKEIQEHLQAFYND